MSVKEIKLPSGKSVLVDEEDFEYLNQFKWYAQWNGYTWYACRKTSRINGKARTIQMHREILKVADSFIGDHENHNGLDNRKENLRVATHQQSQFNKNHYKTNKLGIKGVCWHKKLKKFQATIRINKIKTHLGYFNVLGDADSAYRIAEEKYFGEFARAI